MYTGEKILKAPPEKDFHRCTPTDIYYCSQVCEEFFRLFRFHLVSFIIFMLESRLGLLLENIYCVLMKDIMSYSQVPGLVNDDKYFARDGLI